ncbi:MAG TPA: DinB family protein [Bacilli bacterium]|nr:DinB family protein [Bacilli bacterium]
MSELIKQQFVRTRQALSKTLEDVSPEVFATIPEGFNNNIHWQLGHILSTGDFFMFFGQQKLPASYNEIFGNGTKPADWDSDVPSVETLLEQLNEQLAQIQALPSEVFSKELPKTILGNKTTGELASMGAYHEAMHVGQIQAMKCVVEANK